MASVPFLCFGFVAAVAFVTSADASAPLLPACASFSTELPLPSTCSAYAACRSELCRCAGLPSNPDGSCSLTNAPCPRIGSCLGPFMQCLVALKVNRTSAEAACATLGSAVYLSELSAIAAGWSSSQLKRSCSALTCNATNNTCAFSNDPCGAIETTRHTPHPTDPAVSYVLRARVDFAGRNFALILGNATLHAAMVAAFVHDLAAYLGIGASAIAVFDLRGAMEADFGITTATGHQLPRLMVSVESIRYGPTFIDRTRTVYAQVNNDTSEFTVARVVVLSTLPPETPRAVATEHPTPAPGLSNAHVPTSLLITVVAATAAAAFVG